MHHIRRALKDIRDNSFISFVTIVTIMLSVVIASAFFLFLINAGDQVDSWKGGVKVIVYVEKGSSPARVNELLEKISGVKGIKEAIFLPRDRALEDLKKQMAHQASLLDNLRENPLPDVVEVRLSPSLQQWEMIETIAEELEKLALVAEVEYGQRWMGRFIRVFNLLKVTGIGLGALFFMISVFIIANTIRLALHGRREEVEIMRLVGAEDNYIKLPFYFQGMLQGAMGGSLGLGLIYGAYLFLLSNLDQGPAALMIHVRFFPVGISCAIILSSAMVGWLGCYLSLKQFLRV